MRVVQARGRSVWSWPGMLKMAGSRLAAAVVRLPPPKPLTFQPFSLTPISDRPPPAAVSILLWCGFEFGSRSTGLPIASSWL
jgi:hypothetical protein